MSSRESNPIDSVIRRVVLVALGILEHDGTKYYGKNAVVSYLHEISANFDEALFVCQVVEGRANFETELDERRVKPIPLGYGRYSGVIPNLRAFVWDQILLAKLVNRRTAVIINSPMIWFTPVLPIVALRSGHLLGYIAGDYLGLARLQASRRDLNGFVTALATIINGVLISLLSHSLLVCGDTARYKSLGPKVEESKPISVFVENDRKARSGSTNKGRFVVLFVGNLNFNKGVHVLIEAVGDLIHRGLIDGRAIELRIVGDGVELRNLKEEARRMELEDKVVFLGWIDNANQLAKEYLSADVCVLPSIVTEGSPRVIDEAMYYGVPVVATDLKYGSIYSNMHNIILVEPNSSKKISDAIVMIASDENLKMELAESGRSRIDSILKGGSAASQQSRIILGRRS